jgi:uncharacterized protein YjgD (DUF1641 family)
MIGGHMNIIIKWSDNYEDKPKEELSMYLDNEIEKFSQYMEKLSDLKAAGVLHPLEKAIVKTYLIYKLKNP